MIHLLVTLEINDDRDDNKTVFLLAFLNKRSSLVT